MAKKVKPRAASQSDIDFGVQIRDLRQNRGMTQMQLGETLGVSFQQVQKYEKGTNRVSSARMQLIAKTLKVPISQFYAPSDEVNKAISLFHDLDPATMRMLKVYGRIKSQEVQHRIVMLIEAVADENS